jgi:hypothetical protein
MKIRTAEQLYDSLAADLVWRKKELTTYRIALQATGNNPERRDAFLRGAVALLYAHWEGYVKQAGSAYLEFVAAQRLKYGELSIPVLAIAIRPMLRAASDAQRIAKHVEVVDFLLRRMDERSLVPYKEAISTRANLSSRVLREIIDTLGLSYLPFEGKATLIDEGLVERRNTIAHGEYLTLTLDHYDELSDQILLMMEELTTQLSNAATLGQFRRVA